MTPSVMAKRLMNAQCSIVASIEAFGKSLGINVIGPPNHRDPAVRAMILVEWIDARLKEIGSAIGVDLCVAPILPEPEPEPKLEPEPEPVEQDAEPLESVELGMDGELAVQPEATEQPAEPDPEPEPKTSRKRK